jgi:uncharacterized membrane protein
VHTPFSWLRTLIFLCLLVFFIALVQLDIVTVAFEKLHLSREAAYMLFMSTLIGSLMNQPLFSMAVRPPAQDVPGGRRCARCSACGKCRPRET